METLAVTVCYGPRWHYKASSSTNAVSSILAEILRTLDVVLSVATPRQWALLGLSPGGKPPSQRRAVPVRSPRVRMHACDLTGGGPIGSGPDPRALLRE